MGRTQILTAVDGVAIAYECRRSMSITGATPLMLIHGAASNMTRWSEFAEQTRLASSHDILRLDLRGHAQSLYRGPIGLELWCDDIAAILRHEGYERAVLMGHCLGANVAMMFAARYPQYSAGLVLVEPMLRQALTGKLRLLRSLALPFKFVVAVIRMFNRLGVYRHHLQTLDLRSLDAQFRALLSEPGGAEALTRRYGSPWQDIKTMPSANFFQDLLEVLRPLPLDKIGVPFLALLSTGRTFADPDVTASLLRNLPRGEIHTLEARHWIPTEQPQAMRTLIERWMAVRPDLG